MHPLCSIVVVVGFDRHAHHVPPCNNIDLFLGFLIILKKWEHVCDIQIHNQRRKKKKEIYIFNKILKDLEHLEHCKVEVFKLGQVHYTIELVWSTLFIVVPCKQCYNHGGGE